MKNNTNNSKVPVVVIEDFQKYYQEKLFTSLDHQNFFTSLQTEYERMEHPKFSNNCFVKDKGHNCLTVTIRNIEFKDHLFRLYAFYSILSDLYAEGNKNLQQGSKCFIYHEIEMVCLNSDGLVNYDYIVGSFEIKSLELINLGIIVRDIEKHLVSQSELNPKHKIQSITIEIKSEPIEIHLNSPKPNNVFSSIQQYITSFFR
jgi:hypothetical protein